MVAQGEHAWLLGGMRGCSWGGVHGCSGGVCVVAPGGACVAAPEGGHAWFYLGGMRGFFSFFGYNEIRSMSGWHASYWNAFLLFKLFHWI